MLNETEIEATFHGTCLEYNIQQRGVFMITLPKKSQLAVVTYVPGKHGTAFFALLNQSV